MMDINKTTGLIAGIPYLPSPHCDDRLPGTDINLLVIHGISLPPGKFGSHYIDDFFLGKLNAEEHPYFKTIEKLRVSAHVLIKRDGTITQYVPFFKRAWHAGESYYEDRTGCNDFSIGIELEGTDSLPYEMIQYSQLADLTLKLMRAYPSITADRVVGHCDIAPGRKTDPGPLFDWVYFRHLLNS